MKVELVVFEVVEHLFDCHVFFKRKVGFAVLSIRVGFEVLCWTWSIFLERGLNIVCGIYVVWENTPW